MRTLPFYFIVSFLLIVCYNLFGNPIINTINHYPLHPSNNSPVNFKINVNSKEGIVRVVLSFIEFDCFENSNGSRSTKPRNDGKAIVIKDLKFDVPKKEYSTTITYTKGFVANSLITYTWQIEDKLGKIIKSASMQAGDSPYGEKEILLYSNSNLPSKKIFNICFIPDKSDFGNNTKTFLDSLKTTIFKGYLMNNMIKDHSENWAFYYTPSSTEVTTESTRVIPVSVRQSGIIDAFALMHKSSSFTDRSGGNVFSSETFRIGTVVHETAHSIFGLNDERNGTGSVGGCNVFRNSNDCENANNSQNCRTIKVDGKTAYVPESATPNCIMNNDGDKKMYPFRSVCSECILEKYKNQNNHFLDKNIANIDSFPLFQTEKVIVVKITFVEGKWHTEVVGTSFGKITRTSGSASRLKINLTGDVDGTQEKLIHTLEINNPRVQITHLSTEIKEEFTQEGSVFIMIPFDKNISRLDLIAMERNNKISESFEIGDAIQKTMIK